MQQNPTHSKEIQEYPFFLTVDELHQLLPYSKNYLRNLFRDGRLPGIKLGGRWAIPQPALLEWIKKSNRKEVRGTQCPYFPELKHFSCPGHLDCDGTCEEVEAARTNHEIMKEQKHENRNEKIDEQSPTDGRGFV